MKCAAIRLSFDLSRVWLIFFEIAFTDWSPNMTTVLQKLTAKLIGFHFFFLFCIRVYEKFLSKVLIQKQGRFLGTWMIWDFNPQIGDATGVQKNVSHKKSSSTNAWRGHLYDFRIYRWSVGTSLLENFCYRNVSNDWTRQCKRSKRVYPLMLHQTFHM